MKTIWMILATLMAVACGGQPDGAAPVSIDSCYAYNKCIAEPAAASTCNDGWCSCITSGPGENRAVSCNVGATDGN